MGKDRNSFQKRLREADKKRKADDKRKRRQLQKTVAANHNAAALASKAELEDDSSE
jgi:hypothetical protein